MEFIPFEFPKMIGKINGEEQELLVMLDDAGVLRCRREELKMTQQQVADAAGIKVSQYQRFESGERTPTGASMRIGLNVCRVLKLDPYLFFGG